MGVGVEGGCTHWGGVEGWGGVAGGRGVGAELDRGGRGREEGEGGFGGLEE